MELIFGLIVLVAIAYGLYFYWANRPVNNPSVAPYKVEVVEEVKPTVEIIEFKKADNNKGKMAKPVKSVVQPNVPTKTAGSKAKKPAKAKPQVQPAAPKKPKTPKK